MMLRWCTYLYCLLYSSWKNATKVEARNMTESVIFKRNDMIAVLGENKEFWLCKSLQNASFNRKKSPFFKALWLEKDGMGSTYTMQSEPNSVPFGSIISKIRLKKLSTNGIFELPSRTKMKLDRFVNNFTKGIVLKCNIRFFIWLLPCLGLEYLCIM